MKRVRYATRQIVAVGACVTFQVAAAWTASIYAQSPVAAWTANLNDVRWVAALVPGRRPLRLNVLKFAESRRTRNFSVQGAPADPSVQARTVFQAMYADGSLMIDAGMDREVHRFFGRGADEPYDTEAAVQVARALRSARFIIVTHEHGDHVAGVIRAPLANELAPRTILTSAQARALKASPQMPEIRLTDEMAGRYLVVDYDRYHPLAPGVALISAPGHTPGSQMVYITLESGHEYLLIGDTAWHMDGVRLVIGKDAPWVSEDTNAVLSQLKWLNELSRTEEHLYVIASHDDDEHRELIRKGLLGNRLE
jgi:glyoxylase-like metal-dependent hydrolase (beta-lactamase superfamily II)